MMRDLVLIDTVYLFSSMLYSFIFTLSAKMFFSFIKYVTTWLKDGNKKGGPTHRHLKQK